MRDASSRRLESSSPRLAMSASTRSSNASLAEDRGVPPCTIWYMLVEDGIEIAAPTSLVWDVFSDVEKWATWTASITSVELLDGELRVGGRARIRQPKLPTTVWTVTELTPGTSWTWEAKSPGARTVARHVVAPSGPATRV